MNAAATGDIILAATGTVATDAKGKAVDILAYTGGLMTVPGWGPVAIDLAGLAIDGQVKLLSDHDSSRKGLVGFGEAAIKAGKLRVQGVVTLATDAGRELVALSKDGFEFQASVGVEPKNFDRVRAGESVTVNNQAIKSQKDFTLITAGRLREVSIVGLGCDAGTSVTIAASRRTTHGANMPDTLTPADIRAAERERLDRIEAKFKNLTCDAAVKLKAQAIAEEIDEATLDAGLVEIFQNERDLESLRGSRRPAESHTSQFTAADIRPAGRGDIVAAAMMELVGNGAAAEKHFGARVMEQAAALHARSFADLAAACLHAEGRPIPRGTLEVITAAFSSVDMPVALGTAAKKILLDAYAETPAAWRSFANPVTVTDFKTCKVIRPSFAGELEEVATDGEVKHTYLGEESVNVQASIFAKLLQVGVKDLVNDDAGVFTTAAPSLGRMASRKVSDQVARILLDAGPFFSQGNGNLMESPSALSGTTLGRAITAMMCQRDKNHQDLSILPKVLLVPPQLREAAMEVLNSDMIARYVSETIDKATMGNANKNAVALAVESRLSNTKRFKNASETGWFIFASPADAAVNVAFLDGQQSPTVENFGPNNDPHTLAMSWRVVLAFGVGLGDFRAAVRSPGTNG